VLDSFQENIEWVRTQFRIFSGLDLDLDDPRDDARHESGLRMQIQLGAQGFPDVSTIYMTWRWPDECS
jgi:hypothetical protein